MKNKLRIHFCALLVAYGMFSGPFAILASATTVNDTFQDDKESIHGVLQKTELDPPLRDDIKHIRISPDGKFVLAQDDEGINVITREPFSFVFRVEAPRASRAQFTLDSQAVTFFDGNLRIQFWSVIERRLKSSHAVAANQCQQVELSPDGKSFACYTGGSDLILFDVANNKEIFRKNEFYKYPFEGMLVLDPVSFFLNESSYRPINMKFSPDGRYFAAGLRQNSQRDSTNLGTVSDATKNRFPNEYEGDPKSIGEDVSGLRVYRADNNVETSKAVAFDLTTRKTVSLGGSLKDLIAGNFIFVGADRVVGMAKSGGSQIATFPSGQMVAPISMVLSRMDTPAKGDYLVMRPAGKYPVGIIDLKSGALVMANKKSAIDLYDNLYVSERTDGELGLYEIGKNEARATLRLPRGALKNLQVVAVSPDFKWLAVSGTSRAAVWNVSNGERIFFLRPFDGAYYGDDGAFYVDFPTLGSVQRTVGILQTQQREVLQGAPIVVEADRSEQYGQYFTILRRSNTEIGSKGPAAIVAPKLKARREKYGVIENTSLEVQDARTMKQLWLKTFGKATPHLWVDAPNDTMVLGWDNSSDVWKTETKSDSRLTKQASAVKENELAYLYQILNANTGQPRGSILFETKPGSYFVMYVLATNDTVVAVTAQHGVLLYSLQAGEKRGQLPGTYATIAKDANLMCVVDKGVKLTIYDLATMQERDHFAFSSPVTFARFSKDGKRLFVLTESQVAYVLDVSMPGTSPKT